MKSEEIFDIDTHTSYSGRIRWAVKPLYDEPILQQEQVVRYFINGIVQNEETEWVDVPIVQYTIE